ncbi:MAG TPA: sodium:proton antiporter [Armatimonadota bacterium]|nr:sodium:proton antiporter [Armatimonadota bacterium]
MLERDITSVRNLELIASLPFVLMVLSIAVGPFIRDNWWERNYRTVSFSLGALVVLVEVLFLRSPGRIWGTFLEYFAFIALIASLFVVTGGIVIHIEGRATPLKNCLLLLVGAMLSNVMGTTGAAMLLIRPYLRLNRNRLKPYLVVFFIFLIANVGGALTPIGDPPLFLGYLQGVPFLWPLRHIWPIWLLAVALLLAVFYGFDSHNEGDAAAPAERSGLRLQGGYNLFFLALILGAVLLPTPWREVVMLGAAMASYFFTPHAIRQEHDFSFQPIQEVAILFAGIFATMMPALTWLEGNAQHLGLTTPGAYYWGSGSLSAFLDNAPTYLSFLTAAMGFEGMSTPDLLFNSPQFVRAISVGSVFFGACTYIGNGPNFMVKCIADQFGAKSPSFFGYIVRYTLPILLPIYALVWLIFFH